ncbi:carbon-nitrogen hydrolase family protein [Kribbella sp. NPDC050241]|uniref:carbon-nitrogen hydrolase family protein n=1 Tax=Kribbella sp. NPDC050241 TaxID=3364115 RepID=UPI00379CD318
MRVSVVQLGSGSDRGANLDAIEKALRTAAENGSSLAVLPEASIYRGPFDSRYVEAEDGPAIGRLAGLARDLDLRLVLGGVWTASDDAQRAYNSCLVFDRDGRIVARYRKVHLFRLDRPGEPADDEAAFTVAGDNTVVVGADDVTLGLSICYDLRFPALYRSLAKAGATVLTVPANFSAYTGPAHWEALLRARAIENLCYVLAPAQIGADLTGFTAYGHSLVIDPWGTVIAHADDSPAVLVVDLDPTVIRARRDELRSLEHDRPDVYAQPPRIEDLHG